jgi:uncharacterized membrane protein
MIAIRSFTRPGLLRATAFTAALSLSTMWSLPGQAQTPAPAPTVPARVMSASIDHSALKGVTLKIISITTSFFIFSAGTGSATTGGLMAVINGVASFFIYTGNDYAWDYFYPNTNLSTNEHRFGLLSSLSRNTLKYITFKPLVTALNIGIIYAYTDTLTATVATSTAAIIVLPMAFYANNMLWDWYDYSHAPKGQAPQRKAAP